MRRCEIHLAFVAHLLSAMGHLPLLLLNFTTGEGVGDGGIPNIYSFNTKL